jgi:hypothetical protein
MRPTSGDPASVAFDAEWVLVREESQADVVGFYHTHPSGMRSPSQRDHRTMWAWVGSFGKPLLCLIETDGVVTAYVYRDDQSKPAEIANCELLPRGIVLVYDHGDSADGK